MVILHDSSLIFFLSGEDSGLGRNYIID